MRPQRLLLATTFVAVILGLVFLVLLLRSDADAPAREAPGPQKAARDEAPTPVHTSGGTKTRPELPEGEEASEPQARRRPEPAGEYRRHVRQDGTVVRDHRAGAGPPAKKEGAIHVPREIARVESDLVLGVRRALRPMVRECTAQYRQDLGEKPRLQAELAVAVEQGELRVTGGTIQLFDVAEGQIDVCVYNQSLGITLPAEGHPEVERHVLTYPFDL